MQAISIAVDFPLSELWVKVLLIYMMYSLPALAAHRVQMFCLYRKMAFMQIVVP